MKDLPTLDELVVALCKDYERRAAAIADGACSRRTEIEYRYINYRIFDAARDIVGEELCHAYINEIGRKIGYAYSEVDTVSETTYKKQKQAIKINIAKKLHLID